MRFLAFFSFLAVCYTGFGQTKTVETHRAIYDRLGKASRDTAEARKFMDLAEYFLEQESHEKSPMDSARRCLDAASAIISKAKSPALTTEFQQLQGRFYFKIHDFEQGSRIYLAQIQGYQLTGEKDKEAIAWYQYGRALKFWDGTGNITDVFFDESLLYDDYKASMLSNLEKSSSLARLTNNKKIQALSLLQKITYHIHTGDYKTASQEVPVLAELQQVSDVPKLYDLRVLQMKIANWYKSDYASAVKFALEAIRLANEDHHAERVTQCYGDIGYANGQIGNREESASGFKKYISELRRFNSPVDPTILRYYIPTLINLKRSSEAREVLKGFNVNDPDYSIRQKIILNEASGNVNLDLADFPAAENSYFKALKLTDSDNPQAKNKRPAVIEEIANMYVKWRKYESARAYAQEVIDKHQVAIGSMSVAYTHMLLFKIDSAAGSYPSAIRHLKTADSIRYARETQDTKKAIADLNIRYETAQKEKDIQSLNNKISLQRLDSINKSKNIQLLNGKVQLEKIESAARTKDVELLNSRISFQQLEAAGREKNMQLMSTRIRLQRSDSANKAKDIKVLSADAQLQKSQLQNTTLVRNITFCGVFLLLVILGLVYNQARITKHNNRVVEQNNASLKQLVDDKEVLIKEIHHRVKNNLQMIMSLLESQSAFLENDALLAIKNSQSRVQAMSLIHQKLYLNDESSSVNIGDYVRELVSYLEDSFNSRQKIHFKLDADDIRMDISQAVPLGLIINETVTNSIKYAYPEKKKGEISIKLKQRTNQFVFLEVADHGIGLPKDFFTKNHHTLGLKLIRGLSVNLGAELDIFAEDGTKICLKFKADKPLNVSNPL